MKKFLFDIENQCHKLPIISPGLIQLHNGFLEGLYMGGHSGGLTPRLKKVFQNNLHCSADQNTF